ncbi:hypothetical protein NW765_017547 [Fusarium oxysporum]|nr:hypothetical protein NW765_017547 [Fusarium oxysporum]
MATKYAPACIQQFVYPGHDLDIEWFNTPPPPAGESEDCLNVNIYAPVNGKNKTVMVWFYGGALASGANSLTAYDGSYFAAFQDVIIVTVNYRTNVFGFPGTPELPANATNLGFLDQRFALAWVERNIAAFGGDPAKVTIFGQSAGSESVDALVTSFAKNAPFRAAIEESGQSTFLNPIPDPYAAWNTLAAAMGCNGSASALACMRGLPATSINNILLQCHDPAALDLPGAGVYHASEVRIVFGTYRMVSGQSPFEQKLSNYMMGAWASFAKNPMRGPGWSQLPMMADLGANGVLHTTIPASTIDARCSLFDPVYDLLEE